MPVYLSPTVFVSVNIFFRYGLRFNAPENRAFEKSLAFRRSRQDVEHVALQLIERVEGSIDARLGHANWAAFMATVKADWES